MFRHFQIEHPLSSFTKHSVRILISPYTISRHSQKHPPSKHSPTPETTPYHQQGCIRVLPSTTTIITQCRHSYSLFVCLLNFTRFTFPTSTSPTTLDGPLFASTGGGFNSISAPFRNGKQDWKLSTFGDVEELARCYKIALKRHSFGYSLDLLLLARGK